MLDFLGIGAQKTGTTWLYEQLHRHPAIAFPGGRELHFWDRPKGRTLQWYLRLFSEGKAGIRQGEITPAYAILPPATIAEIHRLFPDTRLVYLIRNPIERAWSSALMALGKAEMTPDEASDTWFIDHFRSRGSLLRGDYEQCLRNWLAAYPREQLLILRFEQLKEDPHGLLRRCAEHIGIDPEGWSERDLEMVHRPVRPGPGVPLRPSLLPVLEELYLERIERLESFLGWDLADWLPGAGDH
ncbi:MAG TPA: sulfotransferase [Sedimenticola thiotaurini]|uniref:Sulfotransferase n=1 Tax=Sedimenticola thiotaurini TaxID=1543721 RepID=A0A831RM91_9GAMM|nr:sulfotransferase [Sedimenticola thiotaurini]